MQSAQLRTTEHCAHVHPALGLTLTLTSAASSMSVSLIQNVPPTWPAKMRSVLILASAQDLLTALQEIIKAFVPASLATQEIPME